MTNWRQARIFCLCFIDELSIIFYTTNLVFVLHDLNRNSLKFSVEWRLRRVNIPKEHT